MVLTSGERWRAKCEGQKTGDTRDVFFFNDTATTEIYTLSLHDALPISVSTSTAEHLELKARHPVKDGWSGLITRLQRRKRSEEHTSELQSRQYLVCRLLLEKKTLSPVVSIAGTQCRP